MGKVLLGIDIGTSACKVALFEENGQVIAQANHPYQLYYPNPGWVEQDPEEWWEAICAGIRDVLADSHVPVESIVGIGIDGQSWSCIPVDAAGNCLARTPIWMDTRANQICQEVKERIGFERIFETAGNDFLPSYSTPKMLWFKQEHPEIFEKTYKFLQSNSYIGYKLTGVMSQDLSQGYGIHFFNMKTCTYDPELAELLGLSVDLVPPLYACDAVIGTVTAEAAKRTGLAEGTPVVAGGLDAACGTLGAGVYLPGQTQEQGGQAGGMSLCLDEAKAHEKLILSPHVISGLWLLQGGTVGGGGVLRWFRQELAAQESFDELTAEAEKVPAGSEGVLFLPYMAGERSPMGSRCERCLLRTGLQQNKRAHDPGGAGRCGILAAAQPDDCGGNRSGSGRTGGHGRRCEQYFVDADQGRCDREDDQSSGIRYGNHIGSCNPGWCGSRCLRKLSGGGGEDDRRDEGAGAESGEP